MSNRHFVELARRLVKLEQGLAARNQPQLAHASVEDGAIEHYDETGQLTAIVGKQHDDTVAPVVVTGPTPPAPTGLDVTPGQLQVSASWAGTFDGDGAAPMDFSRVEVHRGTAEDFTPDTLPSSATRVGTIEAAGGGSFTWSEEPGDIWVTLVTRSLSGKVSDHAELMQVTVMPAVDREEFVQLNTDLKDSQQRITAAQSAADAAMTQATAGAVDVKRLTGTTVADKLLVPGSVGAIMLADGAITAPKIAANSIDASKIIAASISGDRLTANTITGDKIAANAIAANAIDAGSIAAAVLSVQNATITSRLLIAEGGEIVSSDPNGPHTTLNSDGFCLYVQADDGTVYPSSRFTRDGATIEIFDDPTKPPTAAIGRDGAGSFSSVTSSGDVTVSGKPLLGTVVDPKSDPGWMDGMPWGAVAQDSFQGLVSGKSLVGGSTESTAPLVTFSVTVYPSRIYQFASPFAYYVGSSSSTDISMGLGAFYTIGTDAQPVPADPTTSSPQIARAKRSFAKTHSDPQIDIAIGTYRTPSSLTGPVTMKIMIGATAKNATMSYSLPYGAWGYVLEDKGPAVPQTTYPAGGSTKSTFTSVWRADFNRSFDKTGTDSPADYQQGILRHGGDAMTHSAFTCGGKAYSGETDKTIAQALNGASVSKVEIGLCSLYWVNSSGGTVSVLPLNATTIGTTDTNPGDPKNGPHVEKQYTARSQWQWIQVPTSWIGPNSTGVRIGPTWFQGPNNQGYFANHKHPTAPPQIRITYTR